MNKHMLSMPWTCGTISSPQGSVTRVKTRWNYRDHIGRILSRTTSFRMSYSIPPGLYAIGKPDSLSPVLVTANYKLSFDTLRKELEGLDVWLVVLNTHGINVWCAAGKGTFGTKELVERIRDIRLDSIVAHRRIIVPQLGASGLHAHIIKKATGFYVSFGPIRSRDIKAYIQAGYKADPDMRKVRFSFLDRLVLTPIELNLAFKKSWIFILALFFLFGTQPQGILFKEAWNQGFPFLILGAVAIMAGAFFAPLVLPLIPSRSFAIKGWFFGMVIASLSYPLLWSLLDNNSLWFASSCLFFPLFSSYLTLNFTGSTPITSISGVKKELRAAIPVYISGTIVAILLVVFDKLKTWGVL